MVFVLAACNLSSKLKNTNSSSSNSNSSSSSSNPSKSGNDAVEQPNPTAAQTAAIANGQSVKWDEQGIAWTLPANWKKQTVTNDMFNYGSGDGAFLIVSISSMAADFPTDISLNASRRRESAGEEWPG